MNPMKIQWIEKTKISKYEPGVDPNDPAAVPYEIVETTRELSEEEVAKAVAMIERMKLGQIEQLDEQIVQKRKNLKNLNRGEMKHADH
jgi:hypothetical protein